jgi:hypothetical protein
MKIVTGGMLIPPKVPTTPVSVTPAARYPARKAASSVAKLSVRTFGIGGSYPKSMIANFWSGFSAAAAAVSSPSRNPTVTIRSQPSEMNWSMFGR